jgi:hypothetical protein
MIGAMIRAWLLGAVCGAAATVAALHYLWHVL